MHAFFQNMGGSSVDLNISYGSTAPSDTSKLWVNCAEPEKVLMDNSLGIQNGTLTYNSSGISTNNGMQIIGNNLYYVEQKSDAYGINGHLLRRDLTTGTETLVARIDSNSTTAGGQWILVNGTYNNNLYVIYAGSATHTGLSSHSGNSITSVNLSSGTITTIYSQTYSTGSSNANAYASSGYIIGNKIYSSYYNTTWSGWRLFVFDLSNNTISIRSDVYRVVVGRNNNIIYYVLQTSTAPGADKKMDLYSFNTETNTMSFLGYISTMYRTINAQASFVYTVTVNNDLLYTVPFGSSVTTYPLYKFNLQTNTESQLDTIDSGNNRLYCIYEKDGTIYMSGTQYQYKYIVPLTNNYLAINFLANNNRWQVLEDEDELSIKVNPISVYRGNSSNQGIKQQAYIYDNGWKSL